MTNKTLSDLPAYASTDLDGTVLVYVVDPLVGSRKVALSDLKTFVNTDPSVAPSSVPWRGARAYRTSNLSTASGSTVIVSWQAEDVDTDSIWSIGAPTRLTVPSGVTKVRIRAGARWDANAVGIRQLTMFKNGATFRGRGASQMVASTTAISNEQNVESGAIGVTAGDYFEMLVFQTSGGALNLMAHESSWFEMEIVEASV